MYVGGDERNIILEKMALKTLLKKKDPGIYRHNIYN